MRRARATGVPLLLALLLVLAATNLVAIQALTDAAWAFGWCDDDSLDDVRSHLGDPEGVAAPLQHVALAAPTAVAGALIEPLGAGASDVPPSLARQLRSPPIS